MPLPQAGIGALDNKPTSRQVPNMSWVDVTTCAPTRRAGELPGESLRANWSRRLKLRPGRATSSPRDEDRYGHIT
jgi:hypothetical protein